MTFIYAEADCVELYATGVMIRRAGVEEATGFSDFSWPGFVLYGRDLRHLLEVLGINFDNYTEETPNGRRSHLIDDLELNLPRQASWYGDSWTGVSISKIEVAIPAPQLLMLRITCTPDAGEPWTSKHTYSGPFAIEWAADDAGKEA